MQKFRATLQLVRLPAVFTAMADIFLGFLLTHNKLEPAAVFGLLLVASSCLYLSGMVFNDVFDRRIDAVERPDRPIPSGRVSLPSAIGLGVLLMLAGIAAAAAAEIVSDSVQTSSLVIAGGLALCILAYDGFLKRTPLGPVAMGGCRFLNVMLGASATYFVWARPQTYVAVGLGIYIAGVTWFARHEAKQSSRAQLAWAMVVVNLGLAVLIAFVGRTFVPAFDRVLVPLAGPGFEAADPKRVLAVILSAVIVLAVILLIVNRRMTIALLNPAANQVQTAVKTMLLSLVMLDATLIFFKTGDPLYALAIAALLLPAVILGRWIFVT